MWWPDVLHKFVRRQAAACGRHNEHKSTQKLLMKLFRCHRAPYGTSKFGVQVKEAKQQMVEAFHKDEGSEVFQLLLPGIAYDLRVPQGSLTRAMVMQHLKELSRSSAVNYSILY